MSPVGEYRCECDSPGGPELLLCPSSCTVPGSACRAVALGRARGGGLRVSGLGLRA